MLGRLLSVLAGAPLLCAAVALAPAGHASPSTGPARDLDAALRSVRDAHARHWRTGGQGQRGYAVSAPLDSAWLERFARALRPPSAGRRVGIADAAAPLLLSASCELAWASGGGGRVTVDFNGGRAIVRVGGRTDVLGGLGSAADSLLALFREALPEDREVASLRTDAADAPRRAGGAAPEAAGEPRVDAMPEPVQTVRALYPPDAVAAGVEGTVVVNALVGRDGRVHDARVTTSVPLLDHAAIHAVLQYEFMPAMYQGRPVAMWLPMPVRFALH